MDCLGFLDRLPHLLAGAPDAGGEAQRHAATCPACADLLRAARERAVPADGEPGIDLAESVLARTVGRSCGRAEELLCDFVDGRLGATDSALVAAHLERCAACGDLAEALRVSAGAFPLLAEMDPGPGFTARVLGRTSRAARPATLADRLAALWERWAARPRFAFEAAYVATLVLLIVVGNPAPRVQAATARTAAAASASLDRARAAWPSLVGAVVPGAEAVVRGALDGASRAVGIQPARSGGGEGWMTVLARRWTSAWTWLQQALSDPAAKVSEAVRWVQGRFGGAGAGTEPGRPAERSRQ